MADPIWRVVLRQALSTKQFVEPSGRGVFLVAAQFGDETEVQVHGKDEAAARAFTEQQNPICKIISVEQVK